MADCQPPCYSSETFLLLSTLVLQGEAGEEIEEPREAHSTLLPVKMQSAWLFHSSCALCPSPGPSICFKLYSRLKEGPCRLSLLILQRKKLRLREKDVGVANIASGPSIFFSLSPRSPADSLLPSSGFLYLPA